MKNYTCLIFLLITMLSFSFISGGNTPKEEKLSEVIIYLNSPEDLSILMNNGIDCDEYFGNVKTGIKLVLNEKEMQILKTLGFRYDIVIDNIKQYFDNLPKPTEVELVLSKQLMRSDGITSYTYGTMAGYHKYSEMIQQLDTMRYLFPNLISQKVNIGTTWENRIIYAVKISDNPDINESSTEPGVYFDGLHHAREPITLEAQLYYMWYLLENYNTNPEVQYLVNNREIFFVPIANPDGYVYNETTNPNGGGDWRKNRRVNSPGVYGVDLNRNYSYGWGYDNGSSNDPNSDTYRGPYAFSEPETQAIKNFLLDKQPEIAFSIHSTAGSVLNPYSYCDTAVRYDFYQDLSSEFCPMITRTAGTTGTDYVYGTVKEMLNYYSSGTTRDYMHSIGIFGWGPEIGGTSFWSNQSYIIPLCSGFLPAMKYLTWTAGSYLKMKNFQIPGKGYVTKNDTLNLLLEIRNKGLTKSSKNVVVDLYTNYSNATPLVSSVNYDSILPRSSKINTNNPFKFKISNSAITGDNIQFVATVKENGIVASKDTFYITVGATQIIFQDNAETGTSNWTKSGTGKQWDTTYITSWTGNKSFADSRWGNSSNSTNNQFTLNPTFNLTGKLNPRLEFAIKFATEPDYDYARIQISTNGGTSWTNLSGRYTKTFSGQPSYIGLMYWRYEQINLSHYIGQTNVKFRFTYYTDNGVPGDGIYIDDFRIVDYRDTPTAISKLESEIPQKYQLYQNYPNPFNPFTTIKFDIPLDSYVKLEIYDVLGRKIESSIDSYLKAGTYTYSFNSENLASGIYFYRIKAGSYSEIKKMIIQK